MTDTPLLDELIPLGAAGLDLLNACRRVADQADAELRILERRARRELLDRRVADFFAEHPEASANECVRSLTPGFSRPNILDAVRSVRAGTPGSTTENHEAAA